MNHAHVIVSLTVLLSALILTSSVGSIEPSTITWDKINVDGFGNPHNIALRGMAVFQNTLVVGVDNLNFSYSLNAVVKESFENRTWPSTHEIYRRLESDGCEIWSYDGSSWIPRVGNQPDAVIPSGFGNKNNLGVSALIVFDDWLYAGLWNHKQGCEIWRTADLISWEQVVDAGFQNPSNTAVWVAEVFDDWLYVGTMNFDEGFEVYRTQDGTQWEGVVGSDAPVGPGMDMGAMNYYAWSMAVYDDCLFLGTGNARGCELWKTQDGVTWTPVIAYNTFFQAKAHTALAPRGFGKHLLVVDGIRELLVYNDELYLGTTRPLFGGVSFQNRWGRAYLTIPLYPMLGAQIWKYSSCTDSLTRVVGGIGRQPWCNGFGDRQNFEIWSMETYQDYLFAGTMHPLPTYVTFQRNSLWDWSVLLIKQQGPGQLWMFDGLSWVCVTSDGFGDVHNVGFRNMIVYDDALMVGTMNLETGTQLWKVTM